MRTKFLLMTAGLAVLFSGCGNDAKVIQGDVKTVSTSAAEDESQQETEKEGDEAAGGAADRTGEESADYKGYVFIYDDVVIEMDAEAAPVIEKLGEANSYFEAPSCAFEGIDKMYTYGSFELDTYPTDDKDYVSAVIFKDDTITTPEGVGIGDPAEKLTEVYGDDSEQESGMQVYQKDGVKLCFIIQDDSVASIEYRSTVLDE